MPSAKMGLNPKTFKGLNKKRMAKKTGNFNRLALKQNDSAVVQFMTGIDEFLEYEVHNFRDGARWVYVPCAGDDCPLCADEDYDVSKTTYRFACNVYVFKEKKVLILEGPKDLAGRIANRYAKRKKSWLKRTWEVSKYGTTPVSYDVESADNRPVRTDGMKLHDLLDYVKGEISRYFGDDMPTSKSGPSSLDEDDDWDDEDEYDDEEAYSRADLLDMGPSALKEAAYEVGVKVKKVTKENRKKLINRILREQE